MAHGDKRNYPKIYVFVDGKYAATTTWSKSLKFAIKRYKLKHFDARSKKVTAYFVWKDDE